MQRMQLSHTQQPSGTAAAAHRSAPDCRAQALAAAGVQLGPLAAHLAHQQCGSKELHLLRLFRCQQGKGHLPCLGRALESGEPAVGLRLLGQIGGRVQRPDGRYYLLN